QRDRQTHGLLHRDGDVPLVLRAAENGGSPGRFETGRTQMMNHETELKLQAYLDGELPAGQIRSIAELLEQDADARSLTDELKATRTLLVGNELEFKLPEGREFYWSKIRRQIEREAQAQPEEQAEPSASSRWIRFLV